MLGGECEGTPSKSWVSALEPERHLLLRSTPEDERVAIGPFVSLFVVFPCRYVLLWDFLARA